MVNLSWILVADSKRKYHSLFAGDGDFLHLKDDETIHPRLGMSYKYWRIYENSLGPI
jgi:hypothetical protein